MAGPVQNGSVLRERFGGVRISDLVRFGAVMDLAQPVLEQDRQAMLDVPPCVAVRCGVVAREQRLDSAAAASVQHHRR
jgi:hypothetical protein